MSTLAPDDPLEARDLERLAGDDEAAAREALGRLWSATGPLVARRLSRLGVSPDDAEDAVQRVAGAMWRQRRTVRARTAPEWRALVGRALRRDLGHHWRREGRRRATEAEGTTEADALCLSGFVAYADEVRRIYEAADRLWLGDAGPGGDVAAAAVQQVLLEGVPVVEAAAMFGTDAEGLEGWLRDPAVLARSLFASLCWSGEALAAHLVSALRLQPSGDPDLPEGWARVATLRARNGLTEAEILAASGGEMTREAVAQCLERYRRSLPFTEIACTLLEALEARGIGGELARGGLWRRIAFEYDAAQRLPHLQIVEREGPAAEVAGVRVDSPTLNNWLSMGRLYAQLGARLREEAGR